jgi:uncharacterized lipoprotein YmbA
MQGEGMERLSETGGPICFFDPEGRRGQTEGTEINVNERTRIQMRSGLRSPVSGSLRPASGLWLLASVVWLLAACSLPIPPAQPDLTRYFVLQEQVPPAGGTERTGVPVVRLRSVDVPAYLTDRPLAVRRGANEIHYLNSARWAEPLDQDLTRNIRIGLGSLPGIVVLARYDTAEKWDYDLKIRVSACEGEDDKRVRFTADWVLEPVLNSPLPRKAGTFSARDLTWDGKTPESLVAALSQGVTQLCEALGDALKAPPG